MENKAPTPSVQPKVEHNEKKIEVITKSTEKTPKIEEKVSETLISEPNSTSPAKEVVDRFKEQIGKSPKTFLSNKGTPKTIEEVLADHFEIIEKSADVLMEDSGNACFKYILNTSGGPLFIRDLYALEKDPSSDLVKELGTGKGVNLLTMYISMVINRFREHLLNAAAMPSLIDKRLPALLFVKDLNISIKGVNLENKPILRDTIYANRHDEDIDNKGEIVKLGTNEFDIKHDKLIKKEKEANEKLAHGNTNILEGQKTREEVLKARQK